MLTFTSNVCFKYSVDRLIEIPTVEFSHHIKTGTMVYIALFVTGLMSSASAVPISACTYQPHARFEMTPIFRRRLEAIIRRSSEAAVCSARVGDVAQTHCPPVNSVPRALFALSCLFALLVLLHVWQAATYRKVCKYIITASP